MAFDATSGSCRLDRRSGFAGKQCAAKERHDEGHGLMADDLTKAGPVEIITNPDKVKGEEPLITIRTKETAGETIFLRIKQPKGRALLVAVHL
jgi:hypothetical protein